MTENKPSNQAGIKVMRWIARLVSIPWAYCALGLAWFVAGYGIEEGRLSELAADIIIFTAFVLTLGATIVAGVWRMEAVGGWVLLADCVLVFVCFVASPHSPWELFPLVILPPFVAGSLFLTCHYMPGWGGATSPEQKESKRESKQPSA